MGGGLTKGVGKVVTLGQADERTEENIGLGLTAALGGLLASGS